MIARRARAEDLDEIFRLEVEGFSSPERWSSQSWQAELDADDRLVLVGQQPDRLVGVATFQCIAEDAELLRVVVTADQRGRGIARTLMRAGMEWASAIGANRMLLEVRYDNLPALGLYHEFGFAALAQRADYYGPGRHALVMEAPLRRPRVRNLQDLDLDEEVLP